MAFDDCPEYINQRGGRGFAEKHSNMTFTVSSSVKLICFDVGGVLMDTCRSFVEGIAAAGLPFRSSPQEIEALYDSGLDIREQYRTGQISGDEYAQGISFALKQLYTSAEVLQVRDASIKHTYPDTETILYELNLLRNIKIALLTNTNPAHWTRVRLLPWMKYVHYSFASHVLGIAKPSPGVYKAVESATQMLPDEILFFDDVQANVTVSNQLRWRSVLVDACNNPGPQIRSKLSEWGILL